MPEVSGSFIVQWVKKCLPEGHKAKVYDIGDVHDSIKIESLLTQIMPGGELKFR